MNKRLCVLIRRIGRETSQIEAERRVLLRLDLSDAEYVSWFLAEKIVKGVVSPVHALNDFVLFRVAYQWPKGAKWFLDETDIATADFTLTEEMAADLVDMGAEGLKDGYRSADWYVRIAAAWYADNAKLMPPALFDFLQGELFLPPKSRRGRRRADGIDRDRIIRNVFEGLQARMRMPDETAHEIIARAIGTLDTDAVRKVLDRTPKTEREGRLWAQMNLRASPELRRLLVD